ncbi:FmdB family zinc ribbon protein [Thermodesulfovibrio thiophilus]|uniref:FmdB family zinc ribbon protein n=1 Tax=Thermodesulfovibrio thiophilus TaxID=340095 RepID=UPI0017DA2840|nr:zinc ribbon domain-containing protein [Thermodesulfovibrio thiophilus]HHW20474.1 zinc ribbon domain-containing protein [Thermodesulfovibrio thiophilus]HOA83404.1 zinc ribbon domain-containing protein [Thermodesulfovibrio thiophilus]
MPVYEYECKKCGEFFEILVLGNKSVSCPKCGSDDIKKKFSTFAMKGVQKGNSGCSSCNASSCSSCK